MTNDHDSGAGSLRQAIADICPNQTITFDNDYTITLSSQLVISRNVTIDGAGHIVTLDGNHVARVFYVNSSVAFNLKALILVNGQPADCPTNAGSTCGGGIYNAGIISITRGTFRSNYASNRGGGLFNAYGTATVVDSVFADNNQAGNDGGGLFNGIGSTALHNTIIADSAASGNCDGTITDNGGNLQFGGTITSSCGVAIPTADPKFGALGDHGGRTPTFPLLPGSTAIDAGQNAGCPPNDQRGLTRPQNGQCDIGAYEAGYYTLTVDYAGTGSGAVAINPPGPTYSEGTLVTLTATALPTSTFTGWSGDLNGTVTPQALAIDHDTAITATFKLNADLSITGTAHVEFLSVITFTIVARNDGPAAANGAIMSDTLSASSPDDIVDPNLSNNQVTIGRYQIFLPLVFKNANLSGGGAVRPMKR